MKKIILTILLTFFYTFFATSISAATYYVSTTGNDSNNGSQLAPWKTIQKAANSLVAGNTVIVREGTYTEKIQPVNSGNSTEGYITFAVYPGETVRINRDSSTPAIYIANHNYIKIDGFIIEANSLSSWINAENANHNVISNTILKNASNKTHGITLKNSSYNRFVSNTMENHGSDPTLPGFDGNTGVDALKLHEGCRFNVIEKNTFHNGMHSLLNVAGGDHNIIRGNYFQNDWYKDADTGKGTFHNVWEDNVFAYSRAVIDETGKKHNGSGLQFASDNNIVRYNRFYNNESGNLRMTIYEGIPSSINNYDNRIYNNVFYNGGEAGVPFLYNTAGNLSNNIFKNNIFYKSHHELGQYLQIYFYNMDGSSLLDNRFLYNNIISEIPFSEKESIGHERSSLTIGNHTLQWWEQNRPNNFVNNLEMNPEFQSESDYDFHLKATSPMIDAGDSLARTVGSNSGTSLVVNDAKYFFDGYGIVDADWIKIGNQDPVQISSVNYDTNTITLIQSRSWSSNNPVYLYKNSMGTVVLINTAPDIGAYEFVGTSATPTPVPICTPSCTNKACGDDGCGSTCGSCSIDESCVNYQCVAPTPTPIPPTPTRTPTPIPPTPTPTQIVSGGNTYYVSTTGNDINNGSQSTPWRTINKAANTLTSGDTAIITTGTYNETINLPILKSGLTFQTQGNVITRAISILGNNNTIRGFTITDPSADAGITVKGNNNLFENNEIYHTKQDGVWFFGSGNIFRGNYIYDILDPSICGPTGYTSTCDPHVDCFQTWGWNWETKNILFEKNICNHTRASGSNQILMLENLSAFQMRDITFRNNIFIMHDDGYTPLRFNRKSGQQEIINMQVLNNTFYNTTDTGQDAVSMVNISNGYIANNVSIGYGKLAGISGGNTAQSNNVQSGNYGMTDYPNLNFHLLSNSPLIDSGINVGVNDDHDGISRPQGSGYDIGAYEYTGVSCIPNCTGKACGDDGCGSTCGSCSIGQSCINYQCVAPTPTPTRTPTPIPPTPTKTPTPIPPTPTRTPTPIPPTPIPPTPTSTPIPPTPTLTNTPTPTRTPTPVPPTPTPTISTLSQQKIYWGSWIRGNIYDSTWGDAPWDDNAWNTFESHTVKKISILHWGQSWYWSTQNGFQPFYAGNLQKVRDRGAIPLLDWGSWDLSAGGSPDQPDFQLSDIYQGTYDSFITTWATAAKNWGYPFFLRFNWEMNGGWYPWSELKNGNNTGDYVLAWRHVHDLFVQAGATNVSWVWCPNTVHLAGIPLPGLYPGDAYVDWTCIDGYNWGTSPVKPDSWRSFNTVFKPTYDQLMVLAGTKPIMIAETASSEYGGSKANWITDALATQLPNNFPNIKALVWFNYNNGGMDWAIESSQTAQDAFKNAINSIYYSANDFSNISQSPIPPIMNSVSQTPIPPTFTPTPTIPVCIPNCVSKACGDDGCGSTCGSCSIGQSCINYQCVAPTPTPTRTPTPIPPTPTKTPTPIPPTPTRTPTPIPPTPTLTNTPTPTRTPTPIPPTPTKTPTPIPPTPTRTPTPIPPTPTLTNTPTPTRTPTPIPPTSTRTPTPIPTNTPTPIPPTLTPTPTIPACIPNCTGKACGDDGCGSTCGSCGINESCSNFQCVAPTPTPTNTPTPIPPTPIPPTSTPIPPTSTPIPPTPTLTPIPTITPTPTPTIPSCTPSCTNKACGDDGCGSTCGSCELLEICKTDYTCGPGEISLPTETSTPIPTDTPISLPTNTPIPIPTATVTPSTSTPTPPVCIPSCTNKACGDDGCGSTCGSCQVSEICKNNYICEKGITNANNITPTSTIIPLPISTIVPTPTFHIVFNKKIIPIELNPTEVKSKINIEPSSTPDILSTEYSCQQGCTLSAWINLSSKVTNKPLIMGKYDQNPLKSEYLLTYDKEKDLMQFNLFSEGERGYVDNLSFGSPPLNSWIFIVAWYNPVEQTANIQINNGQVNSQYFRKPLNITSTQFIIAGQNFEGLISKPNFQKTLLSAEERFVIYNESIDLFKNINPINNLLIGITNYLEKIFIINNL